MSELLNSDDKWLFKPGKNLSSKLIWQNTFNRILRFVEFSGLTAEGAVAFVVDPFNCFLLPSAPDRYQNPIGGRIDHTPVVWNDSQNGLYSHTRLILGDGNGRYP